MPVLHANDPHYLEFVTSDVETLRRVCEGTYGWEFGDPDPDLGGSIVATLPNGTLAAIRGPLRPDEPPTTRVYVRVPDVEAATRRAEELGAFIALGPTPLGPHGSIAIHIVGGIEQGVWEPAT